MNALVLLALCTSLITGQVDASAGLENAKTFARIGDWENGVKYLEAYIIQNPTDAEARLLLAECYFNWPDMQTVGEEVVDKNRTRGFAQIDILVKLGDEGFQMLLRGLRSDTRSIYIACFSRLGDMKDRRAVDELLAIAQEDAKKKWSAINTMVSIERDRERPDERLVDLLLSILGSPDSELSAIGAAADNLAVLRVESAVPQIQEGLSRAMAVFPTVPERDVGFYVVRTLDAIAVLSPADFEKLAGDLLNGMSRTQIDWLFESGRPRIEELNVEMSAFVIRTALTMLESDPGLAKKLSESRRRTGVDAFLDNLRKDPSDVMQREDIKKQLHTLCESANAYVRQITFEIVGRNRDEDALAILLPKLRATPHPTGYHLPGDVGRGRRIAPSNQSSGRFLWSAHDHGGERNIWATVKQIGSPRTTEFLLEKLQADDLGWVFTAARLLGNLGEGRAVEPLKKRYSELTDSDEEGADLVLDAIAAAYQGLSGQPIAEPEGEAAAGRRGMMRRGVGGGGRVGMMSGRSARGWGSTGSMRGRMRGGGGRGTASTTTTTTGSETSEESEE